MRITWKNDGFYRLNIPVLPLCEKTVIASTHGAKLRASSLLATAPDQACLPNRQESLPELTILEIIALPKVFDVDAALGWIEKKTLSLDALSLRPRIQCGGSNLNARATKQLECARHFNIVSTIIKGTAVSFAVFFLSFFAMNYEAYWDIAEHSWAKSVRPKVMQASSLFFSGNNNAEIMKIAVIKDATEATKPLASILQSKTHLEPTPVNTLEPVTLTPPDHRLIIPKIGKNVPIVESKADNLYSKNWPELEKELLSDLKRGVVHYPGTAFPGQKGNVFLTGHSSYYPWDDGEYKDVFALLGKIEVGDEIVLFYKQKEYRYKVSDIRQVKPNNVDILKQTDDNRLTLMTCTPVGTTLRRLVITALQV